VQKEKKGACLRKLPFISGAHGDSVTYRDPGRACKRGLSNPSRKARRCFAHGRKEKRELACANSLLYLVPTGTRSRTATPAALASAAFRVPRAKHAGALLMGEKKKGSLLAQTPFCSWCPRRDSNPHTLRHMDLNHARLPIPPRGPKEGEIIAE
jgi:hypothetical protein